MEKLSLSRRHLLIAICLILAALLTTVQARKLCRDLQGFCNRLGKHSPASWCYKKSTQRNCCATCKILRNTSNPDCEYGDKGEWCSHIGKRYDRSSCYDHADECCNTCPSIHTGRSDCAYGDRVLWCQHIVGNHSQCTGQKGTTCCDTCKRLLNDVLLTGNNLSPISVGISPTRTNENYNTTYTHYVTTTPSRSNDSILRTENITLSSFGTKISSGSQESTTLSLAHVTPSSAYSALTNLTGLHNSTNDINTTDIEYKDVLTTTEHSTNDIIEQLLKLDKREQLSAKNISFVESLDVDGGVDGDISSANSTVLRNSRLPVDTTDDEDFLSSQFEEHNDTISEYDVGSAELDDELIDKYVRKGKEYVWLSLSPDGRSSSMKSFDSFHANQILLLLAVLYYVSV